MLDVPDAVLVIAATNDRDLNRLVSEHAQSANILSNVVDDPGFSTVIFSLNCRPFTDPDCHLQRW